MSDCQVQKRNREIYGVVGTPPLAKAKFQVHNCPRNCADAYVGPTRVPIARTRATNYRAPWEDICKVAPGFTVAAQLMTLLGPCNFATPVYRFGSSRAKALNRRDDGFSIGANAILEISTSYCTVLL
jgi:hypothetical protein